MVPNVTQTGTVVLCFISKCSGPPEGIKFSTVRGEILNLLYDTIKQNFLLSNFNIH